MNVLDASATPVATLLVPRRGILSSEIAVLINDHDQQSVDVGTYYQRKRHIADQRHDSSEFRSGPVVSRLYGQQTDSIPRDFAVLKAEVDAAIGPQIQAQVITWSKPFCIAVFNYYPTNYSITSAFTFGIDAG